MIEKAAATQTSTPANRRRPFVTMLAAFLFDLFLVTCCLTLGFGSLGVGGMFGGSTKQHFALDHRPLPSVHVIFEGSQVEIAQQPGATEMIRMSRDGTLMFPVPPESRFYQETPLATVGWLTFARNGGLWGFKGPTLLVAFFFAAFSIGLLFAIQYLIRKRRTADRQPATSIDE